jgi:hypothetical protein
MRPAVEEPDHRHRWLPRAQGARPWDCRTTQQRDELPEIRGRDDIAPALAAIAANVAEGIISVDEAALAASVLERFLGVLETANRLGRGLSPGG